MDADTRIEIFRPGTFISVEGVTVSYSSADLADIAGAYDPALFDAPLVVGHPKLDEPAYGWVDRLEMDGDRLVAVPRDVEPAFAELVAAKRFKKISAQLYPADHPANPVPGKTYLKHVGFLGAAAPAVKGLKSVSFSEDQVAGTLTIDLPEDKEIDVPEKQQNQTQSFAEITAEVAALKKQLADRDVAASIVATIARHDGAVSFAEAQIAAGKLAPAGKALVVGLLEGLDAATPVSFGEGEANQLTPAAAFRKLFDGAGTIVSFGELAKRGDEPGEASLAEQAASLSTEAMSFADAEVAAGRSRPSSTEAVNHIKRKRAAEQQA